MDNIFFGLLLSLASFEIGLYIYQKTKFVFFNPLLISSAIIIIILLLFKIPFKTYNIGAQVINSFLGPITIILAVPLYRQWEILVQNPKTIIIALFSGVISAVGGVVIVGFIFNFDQTIIFSLIPKSVTTPIALEISKSLNGNQAITVASIIISGIVGAIISPFFLKLFKISNPIAQGLAIGNSSHAIGTTRAMEMGEVQGAMSSLSIALAGIFTVLIVSIIQIFL